MRKYFADQNGNPPIKINLACVFLRCCCLRILNWEMFHRCTTLLSLFVSSTISSIEAFSSTISLILFAFFFIFFVFFFFFFLLLICCWCVSFFTFLTKKKLNKNLDGESNRVHWSKYTMFCTNPLRHRTLQCAYFTEFFVFFSHCCLLCPLILTRSATALCSIAPVCCLLFEQ